MEDKRLALHAKYLITDDDTVMIGSANIDPRSLRLNTEVGLIMRDRRLNKAIRNFLLRRILAQRTPGGLN
ncbi:phospholipase D-like domain-containing protein [Roseobacter sp.]|uniref:phospholipase D-like domain-containing protein n=1 Tax=Roseobacter sp. TaxID=1907202 RepID=UPI00344F2E09